MYKLYYLFVKFKCKKYKPIVHYF